MARFEDLPVEIINFIFSQLLIPCRDEWSEYMTEYPKADAKALVSLTGTSRLCRSLALPILFQSIDKSHKGEYIFNMFNSHQDLTQLTKALTLPFSRHSNSDYSDVQDTATRLGVGDPVDYSIQQGRPETAEASLALALCSNLERLKIHLPDHKRSNDWSNKSFGPTFSLFRIISWELETAVCLENMKYLECFTSQRQSSRNRTLCGIPRLLQLTPKVEVLVLRGYCGKDYRLREPFRVDVCRPALQSLVEIQLLEWPLSDYADDDIDVFGQILTATTRLETFVYVNEAIYNWGWETTPRKLINMLLPVQSTLQNLTLDYGKRSLLPFNHGRFDSEEVVIKPDQLKRFTHLKSLAIRQCVYCHHQLDREAEGATYLADLLPLTIRKLTIYFPRHNGAVQCMDCILYLVQRVVAGDFPSLEFLQINAHFDQLRVVNFGRRNGRRKRLRWTAEDAARKTMIYDKELANAARREEGRKEKLLKAFAGSGVEIRYRAWQTVDEDRYFRDFES
ncbi:uncharacterized protein B0J16DRAFT_379708 [Fusarium flagelliforme]|uniref:uncharacterized protein n=1 Tax=Fusarium flagelliforme TaxID=2675880 RepID=UPI001E8E1431|nr:uncharacterized protein B0J16DRAFT_379708 [Fusarium flagelliforme]KAH7191819.1 hypothetical protein B0J16DRAFT_379708 [Fusarium flagelliforme]